MVGKIGEIWITGDNVAKSFMIDQNLAIAEDSKENDEFYESTLVIPDAIAMRIPKMKRFQNAK